MSVTVIDHLNTDEGVRLQIKEKVRFNYDVLLICSHIELYFVIKSE